MFTRITAIRLVMGVGVLCSGVSLCQEKPAATGNAGTIEFPVIMKQKVEAGKTPVGTKVQAELVMATLVDGKTVPRDAVLSGEVTESVAKTETEPSRLAIRMDSIQWKKGSAPIKAYLTAWFYPINAGPSPDVRYGPADGPMSKTWNGMGTYPGSAASQPFPDTSVTDPQRPTPDTPATSISKHRTLMKDVESARKDDGTVAITCKRFNLKLDKLTTYVMATGDLLARN